MIGLQAPDQIKEQALRRCHLRAAIGPLEDGLHPRTLPLGQMVEHVAEFVHLAALDQRRVAEGVPHGFPQRLGAIQQHQQTPVRAQATALQIREEALTQRRVLGGALPEAQGVFLTVGGDPQCDDEAVLPDVHAVEQEPDQVECLEGRGLPRFELRACPGDEAPTHGALAGPPTRHRGRQRLQAAGVLACGHADEHLFDGTSMQRVRVGHRAKRRQHDLVSVCADPRPTNGHRATAQHDLAGHRAGAGGGPVGLMRIPRAAERRAIFLEHHVEHAQARAHHQLEEFRFRVDQEFHQRQGPDGGRGNSSDRTGYARLLHGGSLLAG